MGHLLRKTLIWLVKNNSFFVSLHLQSSYMQIKIIMKNKRANPLVFVYINSWKSGCPSSQAHLYIQLSNLHITCELQLQSSSMHIPCKPSNSKIKSEVNIEITSFYLRMWIVQKAVYITSSVLTFIAAYSKQTISSF